MNFPAYLILSAFNGAIWSALLGALARWLAWHWMPSPVALWIGIGGLTLLALVVWYVDRDETDNRLHITDSIIICSRIIIIEEEEE